MPTVKIIGPCRFHFYTADESEPLHIHVVRDDATAKYWLDPIRLSSCRDFSRVERNRIEKLIAEHRAEFRRKWDEYFHTR